MVEFNINEQDRQDFEGRRCAQQCRVGPAFPGGKRCARRRSHAEPPGAGRVTDKAINAETFLGDTGPPGGRLPTGFGLAWEAYVLHAENFAIHSAYRCYSQTGGSAILQQEWVKALIVHRCMVFAPNFLERERVVQHMRKKLKELLVAPAVAVAILGSGLALASTQSAHAQTPPAATPTPVRPAATPPAAAATSTAAPRPAATPPRVGTGLAGVAGESSNPLLVPGAGLVVLGILAAGSYVVIRRRA